MDRKQYDTFILSDTGKFPQEQETEIILRELTPEDRRLKYRSFYAKALVSKVSDRYPDILRVRLGRGQLLEETWSVRIVQEIDRFDQEARL